ncbi:YARHG domain-containing protein [Methylobacterium phyllosphaerae]
MLKLSLLSSALMLASVPYLSAQSCEEAYYQRNILYKNAGYCFKTPRAIQMFGNAGCRYDSVVEVPLSKQQRAAISEIQAFEQTHRCPR